MDFDVAVIASGSGGYVCAIRCAQLGLKTAIVEEYNELNDICLNVNCIPSKAPLDSIEHFHNARENFREHGINLRSLKGDKTQMIHCKHDVVSKTTDGMAFLMKKNKITTSTGWVRFRIRTNQGHFIVGIQKS